MERTAVVVRIDERIAEFRKYATWFRNSFMLLKFIQISALGAIPVVAVAVADERQRYVTALLGGVVIVIETLLQTFQVQRYWIQWRGSERKLQHEKFLFVSQAGPYKSLLPDESQVLLAERIENYLLEEEYPGWKEITESLGKQSKSQ